jgi:hypothetical protein
MKVDIRWMTSDTRWIEFDNARMTVDTRWMDIDTARMAFDTNRMTIDNAPATLNTGKTPIDRSKTGRNKKIPDNPAKNITHKPKTTGQVFKFTPPH